MNSTSLPVDESKNYLMGGKQCRPWSFCGIRSRSTLFAQVCLSKYLGYYNIYSNKKIHAVIVYQI